MFEILLIALVCVCTWLGIREIRKPRQRKSKVVLNQSPLIERLFGKPFYFWLCLRFWPDRVTEEMLVTIQYDTGKVIKSGPTLPYVQTDSGLWIPAR
jgi:hypothetical protein